MTIADMIVSIGAILYIYKKNKTLINPYSVVLIVWGILVPITSFSTILMSSMSVHAWEYVIIGELVILLGIYFSNKVFLTTKDNFKKKCTNKNSFKLTRKTYKYLIFFLIISISTILMQFIFYKGIPIFSSNTSAAKEFELFPGYNIVANLGTVSIFCIFQDKKYRVKKYFIALAILYFVILILTGIRFSIILTLLMIISSIKFNRKNIKYLISLIVLIIIIFFIANSFRRSNESISLYFIQSGLYNGTVSSFNLTEILRYFGMSQRTMDMWIQHYDPGINMARFTLYPFAKMLFIDLDSVKDLSIYGYNATNIFSYLYADFGFLWPIVALIWSYIWGKTYIRCKSNGNLISRYWWSIGMISYVLSFYCYINAYTYWLTIYPLLIIMVS